MKYSRSWQQPPKRPVWRVLDMVGLVFRSPASGLSYRAAQLGHSQVKFDKLGCPPAARSTRRTKRYNKGLLLGSERTLFDPLVPVVLFQCHRQYLLAWRLAGWFAPSGTNRPIFETNMLRRNPAYAGTGNGSRPRSRCDIPRPLK